MDSNGMNINIIRRPTLHGHFKINALFVSIAQRERERESESEK